MKETKTIILCLAVLSLVLLMAAPGRSQSRITVQQFQEAKGFYDDPRPYLKTLDYKKILPAAVYGELTTDPEAAAKAWAELVGFKAPDVVGKIATEIKPGKYTYKDKEKYNFKDLMIPGQYAMFAPSKPPHACNFPEIEVLPTRQYYYNLRVAEATKRNEGKTKLDAQGYIISSSWESGLPYPMPSGPFKAQQLLYNWEKRYGTSESGYMFVNARGFNRSLAEDAHNVNFGGNLLLAGRVIQKPYGWFDERAKKYDEMRAISTFFYQPQDSFGMAVSTIAYSPVEKLDLNLAYVPAIRRVKKMSATDTQDAVGGQDQIYDDKGGFGQKLNPKFYPYKFELIGDREYLVPTYTWDGSIFVTSKEKELRNYKFERRPTYVIQLTQLDPGYVYSKRIIYMDKELFQIYRVENFDQKGRLYRTTETQYAFTPEMGGVLAHFVQARDHVDLHSFAGQHLQIPDSRVGRDVIAIESLSRMK
jgi:hypothetical protein